MVCSLSIVTGSEHLNCFWPSVIINNAALNILVTAHTHKHSHIPISIMSACIIKFTRKWQMVFHSFSTDLKSHKQHLRGPVASHLILVIFRFLNFIHSGVCSDSSFFLMKLLIYLGLFNFH